MFQSTHPRGVRLDGGSAIISSDLFQSTHPRGVRHSFCYLYITFHVFQSTHPRGVRHSCPSRYVQTRTVSIHAPTRGATQSMRRNCRHLQKFQSTHPRGVRRCPAVVVFNACRSFNPRTHEGCDFKILRESPNLTGFNPRTHEGCDTPKALHGAGTKVSIHAPTRGATHYTGESQEHWEFQSTHPRGVRQ